MSLRYSSANDNVLTRQLYQCCPEYLCHIPAARYLIRSHISAYWKDDPNDLEFVDMESTLCGYLMMEAESMAVRKLKTKWIARTLGVHPVRLYNDPALPY